MENAKTKPEFHSSTDKRKSHELPAIENMNGQEPIEAEGVNTPDEPETNLGNNRHKNEKDRERIIRR